MLKFVQSSMNFQKSVRISSIAKRFFSDAKGAKPAPKFKVALVGASGGIGQPLSLLLKLNPAIAELRLHDIADTPGVAADLSHIETPAKVTHTTGNDKLNEAFKGGVDFIVVSAGLARKPGMKREDLLKSNGKIAFDVAKAMGECSPGAILLLITNPVNSLVPVVCDVLKANGKLCAGKIFGVSTLDSVRAATFVSEITCSDPNKVNVPVIGGHSDATIVPVLSRSNPKVCLESEKMGNLIKRIKEGGTEVVKAKAGKGSATLSTAYAASRLTFALLRAMNGESNIVESAYVKSDAYPEVEYLATPLLLGKNGIEKNLGMGTLTEDENKLFCAAMKALKKDIEAGQKMAEEFICKCK